MVAEEVSEINFEEAARATHLFFCRNFQGMQFKMFKPDERKELCLSICYAIYGAPNQVVNKENPYYAYDESKRNHAEKIERILREQHRKKDLWDLRVFSTLVCCKTKEKQFTIAVFRISMDNNDDDKSYKSMYVDQNGRIYKDWNDWLENNKNEKMEYCYPKFGYYTCDAEGKYCYEDDKEPILCFGKSPDQSFGGKVRKALDIGGTAVGVAATVAGVCSAAVILAPISAPVFAAVAANFALGAGISSGIVASGRSVDRLIDKGTHGESLTDLESIVSFVTIVATPVSCATTASTAYCAYAVRNGRTLGKALQVVTGILTVANVGVQGGFLLTGLANLVTKKMGGELKLLDVLQFTVSVFFVTNSLMTVQKAYSIISEAQAQMAVSEQSNPDIMSVLAASTGNQPKEVVRPVTIVKDRVFSLIQTTKTENNVTNIYNNGTDSKTLVGIAVGIAAFNRAYDTLKPKQK